MNENTKKNFPVITDIPDLMEIYRMCDDIITGFPQKFKNYLENVLICVENFADPDTLCSIKVKDKYDLLGLYRGVPLPKKSGLSETGTLPDLIFLYRCPLIRFSHENREDLRHLIRHVIVHEVGHHFGLSDFDMEWIERHQS